MISKSDMQMQGMSSIISWLNFSNNHTMSRFIKRRKQHGRRYTYGETDWRASTFKKSKEDWLNLDDTNGKYFHERLKQRHQHNRISSYQMDDDQWTWEYDKLIEHFVHYYERSLGSPAEVTEHIDDQIIALGPCLSISQQLSLMQPCTERDAKKAIFSIPSHKSPGQMVLIVVFSRTVGQLLLRRSVRLYWGFFQTGKLLRNGMSLGLQ